MCVPDEGEVVATDVFEPGKLVHPAYNCLNNAAFVCKLCYCPVCLTMSCKNEEHAKVESHAAAFAARRTEEGASASASAGAGASAGASNEKGCRGGGGGAGVRVGADCGYSGWGGCGGCGGYWRS